MSRLTRLLWPAVITIPFVSVALVNATPAAAAAALTPALGPTAPQGFAAQSITWVSPTRGWMLGSALCGARSCRDVVATTNAGDTLGAQGRCGLPCRRTVTAA